MLRLRSNTQLPAFLTGIALLLSLSSAPAGGNHHPEKMAPGLRQIVEALDGTGDHTTEVPVILQVDPEFFHPNANPLGLSNPKSLELVHGYADRVPVQAGLHGLLRSPILEYVTLDAPILPTAEDLIKRSIGISQSFDALTKQAVNAIGYQGNGVVVAVLASGYFRHEDLRKEKRTVAQVDFTLGSERVLTVQTDTDRYGHGTHVSGIIGSAGGTVHGSNSGVAPGVEFLQIKVLGDDGSGLTSHLIQAIDWTIQNKDAYGIRVANLSLGHLPSNHTPWTPSVRQSARWLTPALSPWSRRAIWQECGPSGDLGWHYQPWYGAVGDHGRRRQYHGHGDPCG